METTVCKVMTLPVIRDMPEALSAYGSGRAVVLLPDGDTQDHAVVLIPKSGGIARRLRDAHPPRSFFYHRERRDAQLAREQCTAQNRMFFGLR